MSFAPNLAAAATLNKSMNDSGANEVALTHKTEGPRPPPPPPPPPPPEEKRKWLTVNYSVPVCLLLGTVFAIVALSYGGWKQQPLIDGVPVFRWAIYVMVLFYSLAVLEVAIPFLVHHSVDYSPKLFFFFASVPFSLSLIPWTVLLQQTLIPLVYDYQRDGYDPNPRETINLFGVTLIVIAVMTFIKGMSIKLMLYRMVKDSLWDRMAQYIFDDLVIATLNPEDVPSLVIPEAAPDMEQNVTTFGAAWRQISKAGRPLRRKSDKNKKKRDAVSIGTAIFMDVTPSDQTFFTLADILPRFKEAATAQKAFALFDTSKSGKVILDDVIGAVYSVQKRKAQLEDTIYDRDALGKLLTQYINCLYWPATITIQLQVLGWLDATALASFAATFLGVAFIFGSSLKDFWESFVLIFITQPFSVGDRFTFEGYPTLVVHKLDMLRTVCHATDGRLHLVPNSLLYRSCIVHYTRSLPYTVYIGIDVGASTNARQIWALETGVADWCEKDSVDWGEVTFWIDSYEANSKLACKFWIPIRSAHYHAPWEYMRPKSRLLMAIRALCVDLGIKYSLPIQPYMQVDPSVYNPTKGSSSTTTLPVPSVRKGAAATAEVHTMTDIVTQVSDHVEELQQTLRREEEFLRSLQQYAQERGGIE